MSQPNLLDILSTEAKIWESLSFQNALAEFDDASLTLTESIEETSKSRQDLIESTRAFKEAAKTERSKMVPKLIRDFQIAVETLNKKLNESHEYFVKIYEFSRRIREPSALLSTAVDRILELEGSEANLKKDVSKLEDLKLKLQDKDLEIRVSREENKIAIQDLKKKLSAASNMSMGALEEQISLAKEVERGLRAKLDSVESELIENQEEVSRLQLEIKKAQELRKAEEQEHIIAIERLRTRILELERGLEKANETSMNADFSDLVTPKVNPRMAEQLDKALLEVNDEREEKNRLSLELKNARDEILKIEKETKTLKKELAILKGAEFGSSNVGGTAGTLEELLMKKNKKLENEITRWRIESQSKTRELEAIEKEVRELRNQSEQRAKEGIREDIVGNGDISNSQLLLRQRDSLKRQVKELEGSVEEKDRRVRGQKMELKRLQSENLKLFRKIKILETEPSRIITPKVAVTESKSKSSSPLSASYQGVEERLLMEKYDELYEENVDPFERLDRQQEKTRINQLDFVERLGYESAHWVTRSRKNRVMFFVYELMLHLLVLTVLIMKIL